MASRKGVKIPSIIVMPSMSLLLSPSECIKDIVGSSLGLPQHCGSRLILEKRESKGPCINISEGDDYNDFKTHPHHESLLSGKERIIKRDIKTRQL